MPDRYDCSFLKTAKYVVSIEGMDWGLAVDQVHQPSRIHPDEVTWRFFDAPIDVRCMRI